MSNVPWMHWKKGFQFYFLLQPHILVFFLEKDPSFKVNGIFKIKSLLLISKRRKDLQLSEGGAPVDR
jgi:hypothetical protein